MAEKAVRPMKPEPFFIAGTMRDMLHILFRRKVLILVVFLLFVGGTTLLCYTLTPVYTANALILLKPKKEDTSLLVAKGGPVPVKNVSVEDINTEIGIIRSQEIAKRVVEELKLHHTGPEDTFLKRLKGKIKETMISLDLVEELTPFETAVLSVENDLEVEPVTMSNLIELSYSGYSPSLVAEVINRLLDIYMTYRMEIHSFPKVVSFFSEQETLFKRQLQAAEQNFEVFKKRHSLVALKDEKNAAFQLLGTLREQAAVLSTSLTRKEKILEELKEYLQGEGGLLAKPEEIRNNPTVVEIEKALIRLREQLQVALRDFTQESRPVQDLEKEIDELEGELKEEVRRIVKGLSLELSAGKEELKSLEDKASSIQKELKFLDEKEAEYNRLVQELNLAKENTLLYATKKEEARISDAMEKNRLVNVSIAAPAAVPMKPSFPKKPLLILLSVFLGGLAGICLAVFLEMMDHSLRSADDVGKWLEVPLVGEIRKIPWWQVEKRIRKSC